MSCSLRRFMATIDNRSQNIRPPKFVPTTPRSIYSWKSWRAHEFLSFLFYYSLPIFSDIMQNYELNHLIKLCIFTERILSREINVSDLDIAHKMIVEYVKDFKDIYSLGHMLSGVHELLHLVECTKYFGPLNYINCFPFEELNRKVVGLIHGRVLLGEEFIKIFTLIQCLSTMYNQLPENDFIQQEMHYKTSNKKRLNNISIDTFKPLSLKIDKIENIKIRESIKLKFLYNDNEIDCLKVYNKIIYNGILFTSTAINTKYFDSCFTTEKRKFGIIENFIMVNDKYYAIAKKLNRLFNPFFWQEYYSITASLHLCHISDDIFIEEIESIKKAAFLKIDNKCFVSSFSISHLFN